MGPFASAAVHLYDKGWHPIPLPPGAKSPPPTGFTGNADDATPEQLAVWMAHQADGNVGVRLSTTVVGIDVDDYDDHGGAATLAALIAAHGPLPPTWSTTSRGPGASRIYYYRVPSGLIFAGQLGRGVDVIQHHHRYAVVAPSQHPDGPTYQWFDPRGDVREPPHVDLLTALPPAWYALRLQHVEPNPMETAVRTINQMLGTANGTTDDSIAERINADHSWHDVLARDGWQLARDGGHDTAWLRPGKLRGISAVLHEPGGPLVVFSTSVPALQQPWAATRDNNGWAFSMFGYIAATRYGGDRSECARDFRRQLNEAQRGAWLASSATVATVALDTDDDANPWEGFNVLNLNGPWHHADVDTDQWLAWPLLPAGRAIALHAPAKAGKSIVCLSAVASMVRGTPLFGRYPMARPVTVGYLDFEMTDNDVFDRLDELGYDEGDRLGDRLHYALLPQLAGLDTPAGGAAVVAWAQHITADVIVFDTFGRAVHGPENDADTFRNFYRSTGQALKNAGIASWRLDHTGKDAERGQRGSSSKNEDVDIVWRLTRTEGGAVLDATHARVVTQRAINLARHDDGRGLITWQSTDAPVVLADTIDLAVAIDRMGIGVDMSANKAFAMFRDRGGKARRASFLAAYKLRADRAQIGSRAVEPPNGRSIPNEPEPPDLFQGLTTHGTDEVPVGTGNNQKPVPGTTHLKGVVGTGIEKTDVPDTPPHWDY